MKKIKIEANNILGTNTMRLVATEGTKELSVNIDSYTYNQIALRLIQCANIEVFKNLILDNGGTIHIEPTIDISRI